MDFDRHFQELKPTTEILFSVNMSQNPFTPPLYVKLYCSKQLSRMFLSNYGMRKLCVYVGNWELALQET